MDSNIILQRLEEDCERMNKMSEKLEMFMTFRKAMTDKRRFFK